jgi:phosphoribosylamine-glycine ligase
VRRLLLLGSGPGREFAVQTLLRMSDVRLVMADGPMPQSYRPWADEELLVNFSDWDGVVRAITAAHAAEPFHGVMTWVDTFVPLAARIAEALKLVGPSFEAASTCVSKLRMREVLTARQVPVPRFSRVESVEEARAALAHTGLPAVIKPVDGCGSCGVIKVNTAAEIETAYSAAKIMARKTGQLLVEAFMEGPEFSVETVTWQGRTRIVTITDKWTTPGPYFVEIGHAVPARVTEEMRRQIGQIVMDTLAAVGLDNSPSHTEVKWTAEGPKIVEVGPRLGGDNISRLVVRALGVNLVSAHASIALGEEPDLRPRRRRGAAIRFLTVPRGSRLEGPILPPALNEERPAGLVSFQAATHGGDVIQSVAVDPVRVGHVITEADDSAAAMDRAVDIVNRTRLVWRPL